MFTSLRADSTTDAVVVRNAVGGRRSAVAVAVAVAVLLLLLYAYALEKQMYIVHFISYLKCTLYLSAWHVVAVLHRDCSVPAGG